LAEFRGTSSSLVTQPLAASVVTSKTGFWVPKKAQNKASNDTALNDANWGFKLMQSGP
jgi:hypothetical protein